ncbi:citrate lyase holo-[acyl-carrier protein] synthase [Ectobacillus funiculus]|uniref:citrate lyase holo-[acyl-carrier protein] synthase n=1 Tax=Ectobacillus funiculus TaxID=137993 RepID=A0ABV5WI41_9BACI
MKNESVILNEILNARETRANTQKELIDRYKTTLVSFTLNIPGPEKNSPIFTKVHEEGICLLEEELRNQHKKILYKITRNTAAGAEAFMVIDADPLDVKKIAVFIEEKNKVGRLFDFDVFTNKMEQISRSQLGLNERMCLVCNDSAKVCGRSRKHSTEELLEKLYGLIKYKN